MTEKKANEIFRTKYPEGEIVRRNASSAGNKFWVTFKPEGKAYYYSCNTYKELLTRFGFNVIYEHDVNSVRSYIDSLERKLEELKSGNHVNIFADALGITIDKEIEDCVRELEQQKEVLKYYETECIID